MFSSKRFEGEMFIRILPTTLLQIFCNNLLYFQVIFKSMKIADDTFLGNSECEWVKQCHGNYKEMKKFNCKLEIEIFRNSTLKDLGVLSGSF